MNVSLLQHDNFRTSIYIFIFLDCLVSRINIVLLTIMCSYIPGNKIVIYSCSSQASINGGRSVQWVVKRDIMSHSIVTSHSVMTSHSSPKVVKNHQVSTNSDKGEIYIAVRIFIDV